MAVAVLACALAAQAVDAAEPPVFFNSVPGAPRQSDDNQPGTFVFNGQDASRTQFPFQAAMYINLNTFCGGSLIHPRWVLTAAHCAEGSIWYVLVGVTESLTPKQAGRETFITRGAYQHEEFDSRTIVNDIGLIQLMRDVSVGGQYIKLIKLTPPNRSYVGQVGTLSGFGRTDDSTAAAVSPTLKFTTLPVVNNQLCIDRYGEESGGHVSVLCLAAEGTSSCKGDSGGPFTVNDENGNLIQIGLVSYGYKQGCTLGWPVGYTNISHFIDWVSKTTAIDFSS